MTASKKTGKRKLKYSLLILGVIFITIQFIPVNRLNPPIIKEPVWNNPETRSIAERACFDCHSNETKWPSYVYVAPISWWIIADVKEGRKHLNMSDWKPGDGDEAAKEVQKGNMPKWQFTLMHSESKLTDIEKEKFISGLIATFGEEKNNSQREESKNSKRDKVIRFSDEGEK